ncbi:MAG: hypothetical protein Q4D98_08695 [Planctomycetia bacterium]|nr:hypothetical protein [Planctomycetia bacterium]
MQASILVESKERGGEYLFSKLSVFLRQSRQWLHREKNKCLFYFGSKRHVPVYAVLGCHSSGSSALMGVLWHLGVYLGEELVGIYGVPPYYGGEERRLAEFLTRDILYPTGLSHRLPLEERRRELREIVHSLCTTVAGDSQPVAIKFPTLAPHGFELKRLLGKRLRVILCQRPIEESIRSFCRRFPDDHPEAVAQHQRWLTESAQKLVATLPAKDVLTVDYSQLLNETEKVVNDLKEFLKVTPSPDQIQAAIHSIRPDLRHFGVESRDGLSSREP